MPFDSWGPVPRPIAWLSATDVSEAWERRLREIRARTSRLGDWSLGDPDDPDDPDGFRVGDTLDLRTGEVIKATRTDRAS